MRPRNPSLQRRDLQLQGHRIGQQQEWEMLFGASFGKAIHGVILEMKKANEVNWNDTRGMKNREKNTSGRVRAM